MALNSGRCFMAALLTGSVCLLRGHRFRLSFAVWTGALSACLLGELLAGVTGLPFLLTEPVNTASLGCILAMGLIQTGSAYLLLSAGLARTDPLTANLICALEPVANPLWVALLCGEIPPLRTLAGGAVVVCGVICYQRQRRTAPAKKSGAMLWRPPERTAKKRKTAAHGKRSKSLCFVLRRLFCHPKN